MRTHTYTKTINTTCGKTVSYFQQEGEVAKMHSMEGPALIYSKEEGKAPEYYLFGIKYSKGRWRELVNQHKAVPIVDAMKFDF